MPLALFKRPDSRFWQVKGTVCGQFIAESTGTDNKERAEGFRAKREKELWDNSVYGIRATASFARAAESYLKVEERSDATKAFIHKLALHFGTTPLRSITQVSVDDAYEKILRSHTGGAGKLRAVLTPLRAVMRHAAVRGWCDMPVFETPKQPRSVTTFMRPEEASALIHHAADHLKPLLTFLIGVGPRLSEALELDWENVDLAGARCVLLQKQGTQRHADMPPRVVAALSLLPDRTGLVFRPARHNSKTLSKEGYRNTGRQEGGQIRTAWAHACKGAKLPGHKVEYLRKDRPGTVSKFVPDLTPHDCRHTWATWHYCVHRDLLRLRDDGGWESTSQVERYAKKMPDHYRPAIEAWWNGEPVAAEKAARA